MNLKLTHPFSTIQANWPAAVANCIAQAKAKGITTNPAAWEWSLTWCVKCGGTSFKDLFKPRLVRKNTVQSLQNDIQANASVSLCAHPASRRFYYAPLTGCPVEVLNYYLPMHKEQILEERRVNKLSPQARQAEANALIAQLSKQPGFIQVRRLR